LTFFFLAVPGFELRVSCLLVRSSHLSHSPSPFLCVLGIFQDRVSWTICWPWTSILLISTSQVTRFTGMNHWHLAYCFLFWQYWGLNPGPHTC
jgi:hypothetical protein